MPHYKLTFATLGAVVSESQKNKSCDFIASAAGDLAIRQMNSGATENTDCKYVPVPGPTAQVKAECVLVVDSYKEVVGNSEVCALPKGCE